MNICGVSHENQPLKIFVVVIPKEGLVGSGPAKPSFGMTLTTREYFIVGVTPKEGLAGPEPAKPSFGITITKTLRGWFLHDTPHM